MATYIILNCAVLALLGAVLWRCRPPHSRVLLAVLVVLLVTTAIFDSLIIWAGIVAYNPAAIMGMKIGLAPVEDFFYALAAALIIPALWHMQERKPRG
jgi:small toxic polypeptide LdrA/B/C/D